MLIDRGDPDDDIYIKEVLDFFKHNYNDTLDKYSIKNK